MLRGLLCFGGMVSYETYDRLINTVLIQNEYRDAARRFAKGDRKALCSPPQRRNPFVTHKDMIIKTYWYQTFQISLAYWPMVRSEENLPAEASFIRHLRAKARLSLKSRLACSLAAR